MAQPSSIEWTHTTWNPVTGCTKISAGCKNCYAERMAKRLQAMGVPQYRRGFQLAIQRESLDIPHKWIKPRLVFVNSMSDLFHEDVPLSFIQDVFRVMNDCPHHQFQVLTKRPEIAEKYSSALNWTKNIWMGTSVENSRVKYRIKHLRNIPAKTRFLSVEPLLGPMPNIPLKNIHWVIVGGESGPGSRPMKKEWVDQIQKKCKMMKVPFFFKQWGGTNKKKTGRLLDGKTWDEMPYHLNQEGQWNVRFNTT